MLFSARLIVGQLITLDCVLGIFFIVVLIDSDFKVIEEVFLEFTWFYYTVIIDDVHAQDGQEAYVGAE